MRTKKTISRVAASAARTTTGQSTAFDFPKGADDLILYLDITAVSGTTPSMTLSYEISPDDGTTWYAPSGFAFGAKTTTGQDTLRLTAPIGLKGRLNWAITGTTPSFTFSVDAEFSVRGV